MIARSTMIITLIAIIGIALSAYIYYITKPSEPPDKERATKDIEKRLGIDGMNCFFNYTFYDVSIYRFCRKGFRGYWEVCYRKTQNRFTRKWSWRYEDYSYKERNK